VKIVAEHVEFKPQKNPLQGEGQQEAPKEVEAVF
jgi:hypothetical protein